MSVWPQPDFDDYVSTMLCIRAEAMERARKARQDLRSEKLPVLVRAFSTAVRVSVKHARECNWSLIRDRQRRRRRDYKLQMRWHDLKRRHKAVVKELTALQEELFGRGWKP